MITQGHRGGGFLFVGFGNTLTLDVARSLIKISNFSPLHVYCRLLQPGDSAVADSSDIVIASNQAIILDKPDGFDRLRLVGHEAEARVHWQHVRVHMEY